MNVTGPRRTAVPVACLALLPGIACAQNTADADALAKALSNRGDVNATFLQPFLSRELGKGRTATINFESTYDWEAKQWNVPLNLMYSKVTKMGGQRVSFAGGARATVEAPDGGPDWGLRFVVTLLYPR